MRTVYTIAFYGNDMLMVYNPKRKGWEMPGGKIEDTESVPEAAVREYVEESGYDVNIISTREINGCHVCAALLGEKVNDGELESKLFSALPDELAFERSEYDHVAEWARAAVNMRE